jgi:hypothetical protein
VGENEKRLNGGKIAFLCPITQNVIKLVKGKIKTNERANEKEGKNQ